MTKKDRGQAEGEILRLLRARTTSVTSRWGVRLCLIQLKAAKPLSTMNRHQCLVAVLFVAAIGSVFHFSGIKAIIILPISALKEEASDNSTTSRIAFITYGHLMPGHEWHFQMYVIDVLNTWLQGQVLFHVLNEQWKPNFDILCT